MYFIVKMAKLKNNKTMGQMSTLPIIGKKSIAIVDKICKILILI